MYIQKVNEYYYLRRTTENGKETVRKLGKYEEYPKLYYPELHNEKAQYLLKRLPEYSVDCVITDPPYGIDYESNRDSKNGAATMPDIETQSSLDFLDGIPEELERVLAPDSHVFVFARDDISPEMRNIFGEVFDWNRRLVWDKKVHGMGDLEDWGRRSEDIHHFEYGDPKLRGKRPQDVLKYSRVDTQKPTSIHENQKPRNLIEFLIEKSTDVGDLVLDPFGGSYTTARAAMLTFRRAVSCELRYEMHNVATGLVEKQLHDDPENERIDWTEVSNLDIVDVEVVRDLGHAAD